MPSGVSLFYWSVSPRCKSNSWELSTADTVNKSEQFMLLLALPSKPIQDSFNARNYDTSF